MKIENIDTITTLIGKLDAKVTAALVGAVLAGIFSLINAYLSHQRQKNVVMLQKNLMICMLLRIYFWLKCLKNSLNI